MIYLFDIHARSTISTRLNISGHQLKRVDRTLSRTAQLPRY
jgi:hypothetical protein